MAKAQVRAPKPEVPKSAGLRTLADLTTDTSRDWSRVAAQCVALRIMGYTQRQIADHTLVSEDTVRHWLMQARKRAELLDVGPLLDDVALPLAVDNLIDGLREGNEKFTLATLQGRGAFSAHTKTESHETTLQLAVTVEMPSRPMASADVVEGQIVGVPREGAKDDA